MNGKSTFSTPFATGQWQEWASPHLTHARSRREDQLSGRGSASPRLSRYPRVSRNIPPRRNKRTTIWQEVIHDTAGLKIDPVLTDRAVFHDLCIVLLVYTLTSCGWDSAQDLKTNNKDRLLFFFFAPLIDAEIGLCSLLLGFYAAWNLRTERIKRSHACQSKERPV